MDKIQSQKMKLPVLMLLLMFVMAIVEYLNHLGAPWQYAYSDHIGETFSLASTENILVNFGHHGNNCTVNMADVLGLTSTGWFLPAMVSPAVSCVAAFRPKTILTLTFSVNHIFPKIIK